MKLANNTELGGTLTASQKICMILRTERTGMRLPLVTPKKNDYTLNAIKTSWCKCGWVAINNSVCSISRSNKTSMT